MTTQFGGIEMRDLIEHLQEFHFRWLMATTHDERRDWEQRALTYLHGVLAHHAMVPIPSARTDTSPAQGVVAGPEHRP